MREFIVKLSESDRHIIVEGESVVAEDDFFSINDNKFRIEKVDYIFEKRSLAEKGFNLLAKYHQE